jgi:hypothetical protein
MELKSRWNPDSCELEFDKTEKLAAMLANVKEASSAWSVLEHVIASDDKASGEFVKNDLPPAELRGYKFVKPKLADSTRQFEADSAKYDRLLFGKTGTAKRKTKIHEPLNASDPQPPRINRPDKKDREENVIHLGLDYAKQQQDDEW